MNCFSWPLTGDQIVTKCIQLRDYPTAFPDNFSTFAGFIFPDRLSSSILTSSVFNFPEQYLSICIAQFAIFYEDVLDLKMRPTFARAEYSWSLLRFAGFLIKQHV